MKTDPTVTIYHNPSCSNSRQALALIRAAGIEPTVIEYLRTPPDLATLTQLITLMGIAPRALLRTKEAAYADLGLGQPEWSDQALVAAMVDHPELINRPIVVTRNGVRLCRPPEQVQELLAGDHVGGDKR